MKPVEFPEQNLVLNKPDDMSDKDCISLPCHKTTIDPGGFLYISKWELTTEERQAIADGKPIYVMVMGRVHPPVMLTTEFPFNVNLPGNNS